MPFQLLSSGGQDLIPYRGTYLRPPGYTMPYRQVRCKFQSCWSHLWRKNLAHELTRRFTIYEVFRFLINRKQYFTVVMLSGLLSMLRLDSMAYSIDMDLPSPSTTWNASSSSIDFGLGCHVWIHALCISIIHGAYWHVDGKSCTHNRAARIGSFRPLATPTNPARQFPIK